MFYCDKCADDQDWPITGYQSWGKCEICGYTMACSDTPSKDLPHGKPRHTDEELDALIDKARRA